MNIVVDNSNNNKAAGAQTTTTTDPLLSGTYQPRAGSPIIEAGTYVAVSRDRNGRPRGLRPTIGAFEPGRLWKALV